VDTAEYGRWLKSRTAQLKICSLRSSGPSLRHLGAGSTLIKVILACVS
jgi:hypothetical protein